MKKYKRICINLQMYVDAMVNDKHNGRKGVYLVATYLVCLESFERIKSGNGYFKIFGITRLRTP